MFGNRSAWFASNTQQCTALRIAPLASSTLATASGTSVSSTGRTIGGARSAPASASTSSSDLASLPYRGAEHAALGVRMSGRSARNPPAISSPSSTDALSSGGGRRAG